jgi:outer membrane protein assembly factor BamE (lipoprotein component of BamABCDE complex)
MRSLLLALAAAAVFTACDRVSKLEEGVSTETQVRAQFGEPATVVIAPDGTRTLEYPRQPEGWTNYRIQIGPDGKMSSLRQLLNTDNFARVKPGLNREQVRELLGRPAKTMPYPLKQEEVWDWRFKQGAGGELNKLFSVTFDAKGLVLSTAITDEPAEVKS